MVSVSDGFSVSCDWPYGCAPTGLSVNGWAGLAFCKRLLAETHSLPLPACTADLADPDCDGLGDCEMWQEPSLLLLHPAISAAIRRFRANSLPQAMINGAADADRKCSDAGQKRTHPHYMWCARHFLTLDKV